MPPLAGVARSQTAVPALPSRDRVLIASCILLISALAWAYLVHLSRKMSSSAAPMDMMVNMGMMMDSGWGVPDIFLAFMMWAVMMVGMMSASATPLLLLFAQMHPQRPERGGRLAVLMFGLGYIAIWLGFSLSATLVQWALHQAALLSSTMALANPRAGGAILIAAGAYQLTPAKGACLRHCQSPLGFLVSNWREGSRGALQMGLRHGTYCLGCCWALMAVLFAVGVMNLAWVGVLTAFVLLEKVGPKGARLARFGGIIMVAFGIFFTAR